LIGAYVSRLHKAECSTQKLPRRRGDNCGAKWRGGCALWGVAVRCLHGPRRGGSGGRFRSRYVVWCHIWSLSTVVQVIRSPCLTERNNSVNK
jgi:hypothetical protein